MLAANDSDFESVGSLPDETGFKRPDYDRDELYDLVNGRTWKASFERKHIGLSAHNKRRLRERFAAELAPWAEARRYIFRIAIDVNNIAGFFLSSRQLRPRLYS